MPKVTRPIKFWGTAKPPVEQPPQPPAEPRTVLQAMRDYADTGEVPSGDEIRAMALALQHKREQRALASRARQEAGYPVVYYFRVGNRIKIGWTRNLERRIETLMPEEVLAIEPGPQQLETRRHRQFAGYRIVREWFVDCPAIREHIASLGTADA